MSATRNVLAAAIASAACGAGGAVAAPKVVADIPAVHGLAAAVMSGVGAPELVMAPGASPHGYAMRPSEAEALAAADLIFWIGPDLTPWLDRAIDALGGEAKAVALIDAPGLRLLEFRTGATFEAHDHDHDDHDHRDDHAGAGDKGHDAERSHDHGRKQENHGHDDHGHDDTAEADARDPHIWLDPRNGAAMTDAIAVALSAADPANAAVYAANAVALKARIAETEAAVAAAMAPLADRSFVVFHDAYHYFEARFGIEAAGAVSVSDAAMPGPARVDEVRALIRDVGAVCVFSEPQFDARMVDRLIEGANARRGELDPQGAALSPGEALYPALLASLGAQFEACLSGDPS